jgi:SNF family Na+-dependent transporter
MQNVKINLKYYSFSAQNFNSIGIAFGSLMAFSSYNRFDNRLMRDTLIISITDAVTCILAGICVFGTLGNLAYEQGKTVDEVVSSGKWQNTFSALLTVENIHLMFRHQVPGLCLSLILQHCPKCRFLKCGRLFFLPCYFASESIVNLQQSK